MVQPGTQQASHVASALKATDLMRALDDETCVRLAQAGRPVDLPIGAVLAQAGDPGDSMFIVLEGELEVRTISAGGREVRLRALGPGAVAGEMAVLDGGRRSADMVATRRTRVWRIPRRALLDLVKKEPEVAMALLAELSSRLRRTNDELEVRATRDLGERLARLLALERGPRGLIQLNQSELARRVGGSREKVNRKLHQWASEGLLEVTPAGIRLLDPERLARLQADAAGR